MKFNNAPRALVAALCVMAMPIASAAQAVDPAKPAQAEDVDDSSKFFWFHRADADAATARTDIEYCALQVSAISGRVQPNAGASFGLIGALVGGIINGMTAAVEARRMRDVGMRKCMGAYGYARYAMAEIDWNAMMRAPDVLERMVAFATAATPAGTKVAA